MDKKPFCFVIMPFGKEETPEYKKWLDIFNDIIQKAVVESGRVAEESCYRVDLLDNPGSICKDILNGLTESEIVIADLSEKNPHVLYELGIRHSLRSGTILIAQSMNDIPFHLKTYRTAIYNYPVSNLEKEAEFKSKIKRFIESILKGDSKADSPVFDNIPTLRPIANLSEVIDIDMPIRQIRGGQESHLYEISITITNNDFRKKTAILFDVYFPGRIPIQHRNNSLAVPESERKGYIRYRAREEFSINPNDKKAIFITNFIINDTGYLQENVFYRVYIDNNLPLEGCYPLRGEKRVNF